MNKLARTIIIFLSSIILQIFCFFKGKRFVMEYNASVMKYNESIQEPTWWKRVFKGEVPKPLKEKLDPTSEWFAIDKWNSFNFSYYDTTELMTYMVLFTITALFYLALTGKNIRRTSLILRTMPFVLSIASGYVILYEIIAFCK